MHRLPVPVVLQIIMDKTATHVSQGREHKIYIKIKITRTFLFIYFLYFKIVLLRLQCACLELATLLAGHAIARRLTTELIAHNVSTLYIFYHSYFSVFLFYLFILFCN